MKRINLFLPCLIFSITLSAQTKIHKHLSPENGLVQSQVDVIYQDSQNYLWFGTFGGLSKWNGHEFQNYLTQDGLSGGRISAIVENKKGELFLGIDGGGVNVLRNGKIDTLNGNYRFAGESVTSVYLDSLENLFIGTFGKGLWIYSKDKQYKNLTTKEGLSSNNIWNIVKGNNGEIWLGLDGGGIDILKDGKVRNYNTKNGLAGNIIRAIHFGKSGKIYVGYMATGFSIFENGKWTNYSVKDGLSGNTVWWITESDDGKIYLCTDQGVTIFESGKFSILSTKNGLSADEIYYGLAEKNGTIYFGTSGGGVDIYEPGKLENITDGLNEKTILGITESDNKFYAATYGGGVNIIEDQKISPVQGLPDQTVWSVSKGKSGKLYFSTSNGFSIYYQGKIKNYSLKDGLVHQRVYSVLEASDGNLYIATRKGVNIFKNEKISKPENDLLQNTIIWSVKEGSDSTIYFCADGNGLVMLRNGKFSAIQKKDGLSGDYVISSHLTSDGRLFIGTDGNGVSIFRNGKLQEILDVKNGLSDNTIYGILEDQFGTIYLPTNKGVNIVEMIDGKRIIRTLSKSDGMTSNENNLGSAFIDSKNRIWFGTLNGISIYDPSKDQLKVNAPKTKITQLMLYDEPITITDKLEFNYDQNYLKFDFVGIELGSPQYVKYRYRLNGVDKDWVYGTRRYVQYTNLNDGNYSFEVQSANQWQKWSESSIINFMVFPAWWKTWWFILLSVIIGISIISYFVYYRVQQLLAVERLRSKIAADLHDNIGSSLTEVYYLSEAAQSMIQNGKSETASENLNKIGQLSRALVKSMSDIVWLVNPSRDSLYDLIVRLKDSYEDTFAYSGVNFIAENISALESVKLKMEYRQHLFLIFKEAVNNCLKYSRCKNIFLKVSLESGKMKISLADDGIGFEINNSKIGNGMHNMKNRAEQIKGEISIKSEIGNGTEIVFMGKL